MPEADGREYSEGHELTTFTIQPRLTILPIAHVSSRRFEARSRSRATPQISVEPLPFVQRLGHASFRRTEKGTGTCPSLFPPFKLSEEKITDYGFDLKSPGEDEENLHILSSDDEREDAL